MAKDNKDKRQLKNEPKLKVSLNEEQKEAVRQFYENDVNFILGDFGSGKTLAAVYAAVASFRKKMFNKVWITRPILKNNLAALPGSVEEKMHPYIFPILQNLEICQGKPTTERMIQNGNLEIMPIEVAKGVTFVDSIVIVDEFQDMSYEDFRTILTRLGKDSKMIFCGSKEQIDRAVGDRSCYHKVKQLEDTNLTGWSVLTSNHRNPALTDIINYLEK